MNLPFVPSGGAINPADHPPASVNVFERIPYCVKMTKSGNSEQRAVHFCWLMHLVGDIHQPLHCTAMFTEQFPAGDRGGNLALVRIGRGKKNLHSFWDGLLGEKISLAEVGGTAVKIDEMMNADPMLIESDIANHRTPEEWAHEGLATAQKHVYLEGRLLVAHASSAEVPTVPDDYAPNAGKIARICIAKAAVRLTTLVGQSVE